MNLIKLLLILLLPFLFFTCKKEEPPKPLKSMHMRSLDRGKDSLSYAYDAEGRLTGLTVYPVHGVDPKPKYSDSFYYEGGVLTKQYHYYNSPLVRSPYYKLYFYDTLGRLTEIQDYAGIYAKWELEYGAGPKPVAVNKREIYSQQLWEYEWDTNGNAVREKYYGGTRLIHDLRIEYDGQVSGYPKNILYLQSARDGAKDFSLCPIWVKDNDVQQVNQELNC